MQNINHWLKKVDNYGAIFQPVIAQGEKEHKTIMGGLITILIAITSFAFLIYNIVIWQSGSILPAVTLSEIPQQFHKYTLNKGVLTITAYSMETKDINPFDPKNLIIIPIVEPYNLASGNTQIKKGNLFTIEQDQQGKYIVVMDELNVSQNIKENYATQEHPDVNQIVYFQTCTSEFELKQGYSCANSTLINEYMNLEKKGLILYYDLELFNPISGKIQSIQSSNDIILVNNSIYYAQLDLQLQKVSVDNGFIFPNYENHRLLKGIQITAQNTPQYNYTGTPAQVILWIKLSALVVEQNIQYVKLSQILANTGAIISLISYISFLAQFFNKQSMTDQLINKLIQIYFPQITEFTITNDIFGRIKKVTKSGQQVDAQLFNKSYSKLKIIAEQKLSLLNQIYEISRLQFIMHSKYKRSELIQCHNMGIEYPFQLQQPLSDVIPLDKNMEEEQQSDIAQSEKLILDDFWLLTRPEQKNLYSIKVHAYSKSQEDVTNLNNCNQCSQYK